MHVCIHTGSLFRCLTFGFYLEVCFPCGSFPQKTSYLLYLTASSPRARFAFCSKGSRTATFDSCTCCVIKPHAVKAGNVGKIIDHIISQVRYSTVATSSFVYVIIPFMIFTLFSLSPSYSIRILRSGDPGSHT